MIHIFLVLWKYRLSNSFNFFFFLQNSNTLLQNEWFHVNLLWFFNLKKKSTFLCYNLYCLKLIFTFLFKVTTVLVSPLISVSMLENFVSITDIWSLSVRIWELSAVGWVWRMVLCSRSSRWENWELCPLLKWLVSDWKLPDFSQSKNQEITNEAYMLCSKK